MKLLHNSGMRQQAALQLSSGALHYIKTELRDEIMMNFQIIDFSVHELDAEKIYTPNATTEDRLFIEQNLPDELYFVETVDINGYLGQIMHINATKSKAVATLAKHWAISLVDIVAFGDDLNDIDMLSSVGIGVAMGNAHPNVKSSVAFECLSNDADGLAEWITSNVSLM